MKRRFAVPYQATSLSLSVMTFAATARAQTCTGSTCSPVPFYWGTSGSAPVANVGTAGDVSGNSFASANSAAGSIWLYPSSGSDYLSIQAPSSSMSNTITWTFRGGTPPSNSFLLFPGGTSNAVAYTTFGTSGNVTPTFSSGVVNLNLSNTPSFSGSATFSVGSSPVVQLAGGGSQSSVTITSAGSGGSPSLAVSTTATSGVPLTLEDFDGVGVTLESNGQTAFVAMNPTTTGTDYIQVTGAQSGGTTTP